MSQSDTEFFESTIRIIYELTKIVVNPIENLFNEFNFIKVIFALDSDLNINEINLVNDIEFKNRYNNFSRILKLLAIFLEKKQAMKQSFNINTYLNINEILKENKVELIKLCEIIYLFSYLSSKNDIYIESIRNIGEEIFLRFLSTVEKLISFKGELNKSDFESNSLIQSKFVEKINEIKEEKRGYIESLETEIERLLKQNDDKDKTIYNLEIKVSELEKEYEIIQEKSHLNEENMNYFNQEHSVEFIDFTEKLRKYEEKYNKLNDDYKIVCNELNSIREEQGKSKKLKELSLENNELKLKINHYKSNTETQNDIETIMKELDMKKGEVEKFKIENMNISKMLKEESTKLLKLRSTIREGEVKLQILRNKNKKLKEENEILNEKLNKITINSQEIFPKNEEKKLSDLITISEEHSRKGSETQRNDKEEFFLLNYEENRKNQEEKEKLLNENENLRERILFFEKYLHNSTNYQDYLSVINSEKDCLKKENQLLREKLNKEKEYTKQIEKNYKELNSKHRNSVLEIEKRQQKIEFLNDQYKTQNNQESHNEEIIKLRKYINELEKNFIEFKSQKLEEIKSFNRRFQQQQELKKENETLNNKIFILNLEIDLLRNKQNTLINEIQEFQDKINKLENEYYEEKQSMNEERNYLIFQLSELSKEFNHLEAKIK